MADFIATTVCQPAKLKDVDAVTGIINKYFFGEVNIGIDYKKQLYIYGYEWFCAWKFKTSQNGEGEIDFDEDATDEFLAEIQPYIEDELIIQMVGNEKCRYVGAAQVKVTNDKIVWRTLDGDDFGVLRRLKSYVQILHKMADDADVKKTPEEVSVVILEETDINSIVTAAKAVGAIGLLMELADLYNIDASEYIPYSVLLQFSNG